MKYIKEYHENKYGDNVLLPQIGDYIIAEVEFNDKDRQDTINNSIGSLFDINEGEFGYRTKYENTNDVDLTFDEIKYWSNDKEDLEALIQSKKYNL